MELTAARKPYHHGNLRAALLETAAQMVDERGVEELSLRELAREVGVSHGAPRRHFADRRALLDALAEDGFIRLEHELTVAMGDSAQPFNERLANLARAYLNFATKHAALLELMFASKHEEGRDHIRIAGERAFVAPISLFAEGQASGEVIAGDIEGIASVAFATLHGLASLTNGGMVDAGDLDDIVPYAITLMMKGLQPRPQ